MVDFDAVCEVPNARPYGRVVGVCYDDDTMSAIDQFLGRLSAVATPDLMASFVKQSGIG